MIRAITTIVVFLLVAAALILGGWMLLYPKTDDPKNLQYVLWKRHLYQMNLDDAVNTMGFDGHREDMILGLTAKQLEDRYGYLTPVSGMPPDIQRCAKDVLKPDEKAMFLRRSILMVIFREGRAMEVILMKVC